jgi:putative membrane protein
MGHRSRAETFFSNEERAEIEAAVRDAESRTVGEIAVMVVDASDEYLHADTIGGVLFSGALSFFGAVAFFHSAIVPFIALSALLFFPCRMFVRSFPFIKAEFISPRKKRDAVRIRALRAFYEKGLYRTQAQTGVLFFLSLMEHTVWVLADKGIYEKIRQEQLDRFAATVSQGVREGRASRALRQAITEAGTLLAEHFPKTPGDKNELSDSIHHETRSIE